jgi:futalosine hydrolase
MQGPKFEMGRLSSLNMKLLPCPLKPSFKLQPKSTGTAKSDIMYILIAAATSSEINTTAEWLTGSGGRVNENRAEVLITGIGGTITAYNLLKHISGRKPDLIIQAGIAGSFSENYGPGSVVLVNEEVFADLGVVENEGFTDIFDLGLTSKDEFPFRDRILVNPGMDQWKKRGLDMVRGATINCISSSREQIQIIKNKYDPAIESMEGAALHFVCLVENIPFLQVRGISNFAGERNKKLWKMKEAVANLNQQLKSIISDL